MKQYVEEAYTHASQYTEYGKVANYIPELAKGLGSGIKNFKNALKEGVEEEEIAKAENIQNPINNEIKILNEKIN